MADPEQAVDKSKTDVVQSEGGHISAKKTKSKGISMVNVQGKSAGNLSGPSKSDVKVKKRKGSKSIDEADAALEEAFLLKPPANDDYDSDESDESDEVEEKKTKKTGKQKGKSVKLTGDDDKKKKLTAVEEPPKDEGTQEEILERELIAKFLEQKAKVYVPPPFDPEALIETEMAKLEKKRKKLTPDEFEELRLKKEEDLLAIIEREKEKQLEELERNLEKERRDIIDQQLREEQLGRTARGMQIVHQTFRETFLAEKEQKEWQLYLACRKLPNPAFCNQMNTYLHVWKENMEFTTIPEASETTQDVMGILNELEEVIALASDDEMPKMENWLWIRQLFREQQRNSLDIATYKLLSYVTKNMNRVDIPTANYFHKDPYVTICVWLRVQLPIPLPNPRRPPKARIDMTFTELKNLRVVLPMSTDCEKKAIRAMYLKYDHLSDTCDYIKPPPVPPHYEIDLYTTCKKEWRLKLKYKYVRRDKKVPDPNDEEPFVPEPEEFASDEEIPNVPYKKLEPSPSEYLALLEENKYELGKKGLFPELPATSPVLNLRKYTILGGVYCIHFLHQPPQPQSFATMFNLVLTRLYVPKELRHVEYMTEADLPPPPTVPKDPKARKTPEQIEEEFKKLEDALDKILFISLSWPQHVIFLELPIVCVWMEEQKLWSRKYIHDLKHNEEQGTVSFRSQVFGIFGLATLRYANLPYQAWEIRPEADGSVTINITAAILVLEFIVKDGLICLSQLQNSPNKALQKEIGNFYKLHQLKKMLKETGIDIFPEPDAFCYVEGSCEKHWPMEKHLYCNMAAMSGVFNFAWSRWNISQSRRSIVLQMREYSPEKPKQKDHLTVLVTPIRATYINCTEVSQEFEDEPLDNLKFSSDLYNHMKNTCGIAVRNLVDDFPKLNVYTISEFLIATKIFSFS